MKLTELYTSILATAGMVVSSDGYVSMKLGDDTKPALIKGKRLALPTPERLQNTDWKNCIAFHPLSENILRGESDVLASFRQALNLRINYTLGTLAYALLALATSPKEHSKLNPDQSEFLSKVKNADEKTLQVLKKLFDAMPANQNVKASCSIFVKRNGTVNGKRVSRLGVVSFPLYQELKKENTKEVYGVSMRVKDRESLIALLEYMIPGIEVPESHNRGSNSEIAPSLDALMHAVMAVAGPINDLVDLFENLLSDPENLKFEDSWVETFENLATMIPEIRSVPMQAGNEGTVAGKPGEAPTAAPAPVQAAPAPVAQPAPVQAPQFAPAPVQQPPAPVYQQPYPPVQQPYGYPPAGYPQAAPVPTAPVHTGNGLDFNSVLNSNPALAATVGYAAPYGRPAGPMGERPPRWASGHMQQPVDQYGRPLGQPQTGWGMNQTYGGYNPSI